MSDLREVSRRETELFTVTRYETATGALTVYADKRPPFPPAPAARIGVLANASAATAARMESDARCDGDADEIRFQWDLLWGETK